MKIKIFILILLLLFAVLFSIKMGEVEISWIKILNTLTFKETSSILRAIIIDVRLPRILIALIAGSGLAVSGAIFQSVLRNPLAEPYTLGVAGGACLGVALANLLLGYKINYLFPLAGWLGAIFSIFIVYFLSQRKGFSTVSLILSGIIINFLFSSMVLLLFAFLKPEEVHAIMLWLMGDLSGADFIFVKIGYIIILPCILITIFLARNLDIISLGDEKAYSLGLNVLRSKKYFYFLASTITGTCIAVSGVIGFVGLLMPHLMRRFFGASNTKVIFTSTISGSVFLLLSDTLARTVISPLELPVGVITGLVGGIFFLSILILGKEFRFG